MAHNYTIYQQALDLQASGFDQMSSITVGVGVAKFMQILLPQLAFIVTSSILTPQRLMPFLRRVSPGRTRKSQLAKAQEWVNGFQRLQGFFVWKLACDLGFFIIVTQYGGWLRAFTFSGLFAYTLLQFIVYFFIGQKLILANFVRRQLLNKPNSIRTTRWKNFGSKLFYEEMGVTISQVSGSMVIAKMLVDYVAMWITWSAYTTSFFLFADAGYEPLQAFIFFPHVTMISLYLSIYLGYAAMFTLIEQLLKNIALRAHIPLWCRKLFLSTQIKQVLATVAVCLLLPFLIVQMTTGWKAVGEASSRLNRVMDQWEISLDDNPPQWSLDKPLRMECDAGCLELEFKQGPYTTNNQ
jgi:hypothetical protein